MAEIFELFGFRRSEESEVAKSTISRMDCPFVGGECRKHLSDGTISGACSLSTNKYPATIICPYRLYGDDYKVLSDVSEFAFGPGLNLVPGREAVEVARARNESVIAVFGKEWGGEVRLPQKDSKRSYYVDWVLARISEDGNLLEFVAVEVQTIDTTGNYRASRAGLLDSPSRTVSSKAGFNWENVNKRIIPQLIYKGQLLQREERCRKGLFFVTPVAIFNNVMSRLGGIERLSEIPLQPASVSFFAYDYANTSDVAAGSPLSLDLVVKHSTTVYQLQEAFNSVGMPEPGVYQSALEVALGARLAEHDRRLR